MGTDAGNIGTLHGPSVFREMALMHAAGLTPLQILRSATTNGAPAMGRSDLGAIAPGTPMLYCSMPIRLTMWRTSAAPTA